MLSDATPVGFIASTDLQQAAEFYGTTLGLDLVERNDIACVFDIFGTPLRVTKVDQVTVAPYTVFGWEATDIGEIAKALAAANIAAQRFDGMTQDADVIWTSPSGARVVWFKDPDGNVLSVTQRA